MDENLNRLGVRLGIVNAMASHAKGTAEKLAGGAEEYEQAVLAEIEKLRRHIGKVGPGTDPEADEEYCKLLMQRHRLQQAYQLSRNDAGRMADVGQGMKKGVAGVPLYEGGPVVYLVSHTASVLNEGTDFVTGWMDVPLSKDGERQARELAVALMPAGLKRVVSSDLARAVQTADIIAEVLGLTFTERLMGLRTWNMGDFQGRVSSEVAPEIRPYVMEQEWKPVPRGESFNQFALRFIGALVPWMAESAETGEPLLVVAHSRCLSLVEAWARRLGGLMDREYFLNDHIRPGAIVRLSRVGTDWKAERLSGGLEEDAAPGEVLEKGRLSNKPQPGQGSLGFEEDAHPREAAGEVSGKYRGGEFVPKGEGGAKPEKQTLYRRGGPKGRMGAGTFYTFDPKRLEGKADRYEKEFHNLLDVPEEAHGPFAGNPSETLRRQWLPHLEPNAIFAKHGKKLGHKSAVDTGDWLTAHAAHERGYDGIRYSDLELQSLLDFEPHPLFEKLNAKATVDPVEDWKKNGVRSQVFKRWFGDWENNPKVASKVVNEDGEPQETYPVEESKVVKDGKPVTVYHGTARGGFSHFSKDFLSSMSLVGPGFYFTENQDIAQTYTEKGADQAFRLSRPLTDADIKEAGRYLKSGTAADLARSSEWEKLKRGAGRDYLKEGPEAFSAWLANCDPTDSAIVHDLLGVLKAYRVPDSNPEVFSLFLNIRNPWDADEELRPAEAKAIWGALPRGGVIKSDDPAEWDEQFDAWMQETRLKKRIDLFRRVGVAGSSTEREGKRRTEFTEALKSLGFDGITHIGGSYAGNGQTQHRVWIAWEPEQIKSADNEGTFDPTNPDIRKSLDSKPAEFVPPDMPRWMKRPEGDEQRFLPLNAVEDRDKCREMIAAMKAGTWKWDKPVVRCGDQLVTGSHRYHAAKDAGIPIPTITMDDVCKLAGFSFEDAWRETAEPYGGWITNLSHVVRKLPGTLIKKLGIDLG